MNQHSQRFTVHTYDIDAWGRLAAPTVAGYLQEAAGVHAAQLGCGLEQLVRRGMTWVLVRQRTELDEIVGVGERLDVVTWPSGLDRMAALREYQIRRADGAVIGRASSSWFVLDLTSRRPVRPQDALPEPLLTTVERVLPPAVERLSPVETWQREVRLPVRRQDIDVNRHANNASYVAWAVDAVPDETWRGARMRSCDLQYMSECRDGDVILSRVAGEDGATFRHSMVREADGKEVCRATSCWVRA